LVKNLLFFFEMILLLIRISIRIPAIGGDNIREEPYKETQGQ
jgi:hypothetical protein